jgi:dihydrolipoamide dehydrogenase
VSPLHLGATLTSFSGRRGSVTARFTKDGEPHEVTADQACVAIGRRWTPEALGAEHLGPRRGHLGLEVTPHLRISVAHIYAAGDAVGNAQLTPVAALRGASRGSQCAAGRPADRRYQSRAPVRLHDTGGVQGRIDPPSGNGQRLECHVATHDLRGASNGRATGEDDGYVRWESVARQSKNAEG